ncbi:MAG: pyruvate kinase [Chloroflexi bacterium]|jgi:pyruvate kinase|uniref:Pyruvate kinase n=1 Tax=Candidatus Thermofonsia Clade 3 bacterium TaxID=2364212 RepID=A0A2M8QGK3_9CHLR|nr:pyruvate kinase [Candidatus Roseilinea sp. NK_OTU-006]PJF48882.1 MAG: pyruvate kinase [Candidatus Thermofonsia Clade 3 bacterium]RMG66044.1 MAG: pyruvate kinase [Chloroflexota bacterium]
MRTKIVCTLGPASEDETVLRGMIRAGMDIARLNFSHGSRADHERRIGLVRRIAAEERASVTLMGDLQGPKFRIGQLTDPGVALQRDQQVIFSVQPEGEAIPLPHPDLLAAIQVGQRMLIDDGAIALTVVRRIDATTIACRVLNGGVVMSNKGVSVPGLKIAMSALTPKDRDDVQFAIAQRMDALAMSFVRSAEDVYELRRLIQDCGGDQLVVAKIEKPEALDDLPNIVRASDAVMVARGDLGVEAAPEEVPFYQKRIILTCLRVGKPVITATQMLQSMITSPQPTRAEASDVANAVLDGTDALMLSGETAVGAFPVQAVEAMARIAARAEASVSYRPRALLSELHETLADDDRTDHKTDAITTAAVHIAETVGAKAIACASASGFTARMIARHRPAVPIVCLTPHERTQRYASFMWGVAAVIAETRKADADTLFEAACDAAQRLGCARPGDTIVVTAGLPLGSGSGHTNVIRLMEVRA